MASSSRSDRVRAAVIDYQHAVVTLVGVVATVLSWPFASAAIVSVCDCAFPASLAWIFSWVAHTAVALGVLQFVGRPRALSSSAAPRSGESAYKSASLASTASDAGSDHDRYLDLMMRSLVDVLYESPSVFVYDNSGVARFVSGLHLQHRMAGEDVAPYALTMIGMARLRNIRQLLERTMANGVPGDFIETGVLRGGASIFAKAVIDSHGEKDRRVILCDTFCPPMAPPGVVGRLTFLPILQTLANIPYWPWLRRLFLFLQHLPSPHASFPRMLQPSDDTVAIGVTLMQRLSAMPVVSKDRTSVQAVRSTFARYGLLDDRCTFLKGYFSDTLPPAVREGTVQQLCGIRLDGDTYESTITALEPLYPLLQPGGFVIVDDYHSFDECQRAVDEYREQHGITAPLQRIDKLAVYWVNE